MMTPDHADTMTTGLYAEPRKPSEPMNASGRGMPSGRTRSEEVRAGGSDGRKGSDNMSIMDILNALGVDLSEAKIVISQDEREITITPKGDAP